MLGKFVSAAAAANSKQCRSCGGDCACCRAQQAASGAVEAGGINQSMEHHFTVTARIEVISQARGQITSVSVCTSALIHDEGGQLGAIINGACYQSRLLHEVTYDIAGRLILIDLARAQVKQCIHFS